MQTENTQQLSILLIEDNPADARLIRELLHDGPEMNMSVRHAGSLSSGLACLEEHEIDLVLLDLSLPDSHGLETISMVMDRFARVPIVVLTGLEDKENALAAIKEGAQDYLTKDGLTGLLLERAVRYAVERAGLMAKLEEARLHNQQKRELLSLDLFSQTKTKITSNLFGTDPLSEAAPGIFKELTARYETLLDMALKQRIYKTDIDMSEKIYAFGERLGFLSAGPRDVLEVHMHALKTKQEGSNTEKIRAYTEEGRILLIEVMGRLVLFYRNHYTHAQGEDT